MVSLVDTGPLGFAGPDVGRSKLRLAHVLHAPRILATRGMCPGFAGCVLCGVWHRMGPCGVNCQRLGAETHALGTCISTSAIPQSVDCFQLRGDGDRLGWLCTEFGPSAVSYERSWVMLEIPER